MIRSLFIFITLLIAFSSISKAAEIGECIPADKFISTMKDEGQMSAVGALRPYYFKEFPNRAFSKWNTQETDALAGYRMTNKQYLDEIRIDADHFDHFWNENQKGKAPLNPKHHDQIRSDMKRLVTINEKLRGNLPDDPTATPSEFIISMRADGSSGYIIDHSGCPQSNAYRIRDVLIDPRLFDARSSEFLSVRSYFNSNMNKDACHTAEFNDCRFVIDLIDEYSSDGYRLMLAGGSKSFNAELIVAVDISGNRGKIIIADKEGRAYLYDELNEISYTKNADTLLKIKPN